MSKSTIRVCWENRIYELEDIPRSFNEKLYQKYGVSDTVIAYWRDIGFTPAYFQLFWLMKEQKIESYEEWMADKALLVDGIMLENRKLGEAARKYCEAERNALDWMTTSDSHYIYILKDSFDDGFEELLILSSDFDEVTYRALPYGYERKKHRKN